MYVGSTKFPTNNEIELISEEIEKGLSDSTAVKKFFEKRIQIEEEYAKNLQKLVKATPGLKKTNSGITAAFSVLVESINQYSANLLNIVQKINNDVNEPLNIFIKDLKSENKTYFSDGQDLAKERKSVFEALKNSKSNYDSVFKDPESDPAKIGSAEDEYREQIQLANRFEALFHNEKLPKIQNDIQRLETIRMQKMKTNLKKYIAEFESDPVKFTQALKESEDIINAIDTKRDIMEFVNFNKSINTPTPEFVFEACDKEKKKKGWRSTMSVLGINIGGSGNSGSQEKSNSSYSSYSPSSSKPKDLHPNAVFSVPIEEVMQKQKSKYPNLDVPYVLVLLVDMIKQNNGFQTEGIFRVPGIAEDISNIKKQINEGDYSITESNVHTLSSLLKLWLRDMPQPLIPNSLYDRAVNCESNQQMTEIFQQLPPINQKIVTFIVNFLHHLILPENVTISLMNLDNVGMVFAPSFLRCTNPELLLANVEKEKYFIKVLIENYSKLLELCPLNLSTPFSNNVILTSSNQNNTPTTPIPQPKPIPTSNNLNNPPPPPPTTFNPNAPPNYPPPSYPPPQSISSNNSQPPTLTPPPPFKPLPQMKLPATPPPQVPPSFNNPVPPMNKPPSNPPPQIPLPSPSNPVFSPPQKTLPVITPSSPIPVLPSSASTTPVLSGGVTSGGSSLNLSTGLSSPVILPKSSQSSLNLSTMSNNSTGSPGGSPNISAKKTVKPILPPMNSLAVHIHGMSSGLPTTSNPLLVSQIKDKQDQQQQQQPQRSPSVTSIDPDVLKTLKTFKKPDANAKPDFKSSLPPPPPPFTQSNSLSTLDNLPPPPPFNASSPTSSPSGSKIFLNKVSLPPPPSIPK